jgi:uncharacterized protein RhaS with RHS repeats
MSSLADTPSYYRARYYDPQAGRFLSEDPLGFEGSGPDFYSYARNNSVRFNDSLGLSAQDVQQILALFKVCVNQLEASMERRPGKGWWNGARNNLDDFVTAGHVYSGCSRQADLTASCVNFPPKPYQDHWTCNVIGVEKFLGIYWHHITKCTSSNPSDPAIYLDPWNNTATTAPNGDSGTSPAQSGGAGTGASSGACSSGCSNKQ